MCVCVCVQIHTHPCAFVPVPELHKSSFHVTLSHTEANCTGGRIRSQCPGEEALLWSELQGGRFSPSSGTRLLPVPGFQVSGTWCFPRTGSWAPDTGSVQPGDVATDLCGSLNFAPLTFATSDARGFGGRLPELLFSEQSHLRGRAGLGEAPGSCSAGGKGI